MKPRLAHPPASEAGTTLAELIFAASIACIVLATILTSLYDIQRADAAVTTYAATEGDQMRISDYIVFDVRRALTLNVTNDVITLTVPDYYGNGGVMPTPGSTPQDPTVVNGSVTYSANPVTITYYQQSSKFYRTLNGTPAVIAENVVDFTATRSPNGNAVSCTTTFSPSFTYNPTAGAVAATSVFTTVYLRNPGAQRQ